MKKTVKVITSAATAAAILLGVTAGAYASDKAKDVDAAETAENIVEELTADTGDATEETFTMDDEVAYVFTNYDGSVNKVMDSVWIEDGSDKTQTGAEATLPVDLKLSYKLDGVAVTPSELEGKTGHLTITCDFTDNVYETKNINGKDEKIYVPYLASLVTVMDDETYSNVTVSSGKVTYDGSRYAVMGLAFPGLAEDMGDVVKSIDIPNHIELEADVKDCEPAGLYLLVSDSLFSNLELDADTEVGKLEDAMTELSDAVKQLMDGSSKLYDGLGELQTGAGKISDGVNQLAGGLSEIDSNSAALNEGALQVFNSLLATATQQLNAAGVSVPALTVDNYNDVINGAIGDITGTDVAGMARAQVEAGVREYANAHASENMAAATDAARAQVEAAVTQYVHDNVVVPQVDANADLIKQGIRAQVEANRAAIEAQVKQAVLEQMGIADYDALDDDTKAQIDAAVQANTNATIDQTVEDNYPAVREAKIEEAMAADDTKAAIAAEVTNRMNSEEVQAGIAQGLNDKIAQAIEEKYNSDEVQSQIAAGNAKVSSGVASLQNLQEQLNSYARFYQGIQNYTGAVGQASAGANKLKASMPEFIQGIEALRNGEGELSDGIKKFDEEGIEELTGIVEDNVEGLAERFSAMNEVAGAHSTYAEDGNKKNVKFIYKVSVTE